MIRSIEYLSHSELKQVPKKYWEAHEYCVFIYRLIYHHCDELNKTGIHEVVEKAILKHLNIKEEVDIVEILEREGHEKLLKQHILGYTISALINDLLQFLGTSLQAFQERKFSVAFSLLRKPLKEHLFYLCLIINDETRFLEKFRHKVYSELELQRFKNNRVDIIDNAIKKLPSGYLFNAIQIEKLIYDDKDEYSFAPIFDMATHLVTSYTNTKRTADYSFNLIFEDRNSDDNFDFSYPNLPYILLFLSHIIIELLTRISKPLNLAYQHYYFSSIGCFESIFVKDKYCDLLRKLKTYLKPFFNCQHCKKDYKVRKHDWKYILIHEKVECSNCKCTSDLPFYWLVGLLNLNYSTNYKNIQYLE